MSAITISLNEIRQHGPCPEGWQKLLKAKGKTTADDERFPLADILDTNDMDDCLWALGCTDESLHHMWRKFAVWAARKVEHMMEDERSKNALEVAWRHANGEATDKELAAAWDAAWDAVWDAAGVAAWSAARVSAWSAAGADARAAQSQKLRQILNAGEWVESES